VARVGDRWILCLGRPPPYVPEVGKRCSGLMPIVCPIRQRRSITVTCIAGGTGSGRQCPPCRGRYFPTHGWVRRHPLGHHDAGLHRQPGTHRERESRLSATDLDQLRWSAEARMPVCLRSHPKSTGNHAYPGGRVWKNRSPGSEPGCSSCPSTIPRARVAEPTGAGGGLVRW
jgi:hypothetical protein